MSAELIVVPAVLALVLLAVLTFARERRRRRREKYFVGPQWRDVEVKKSKIPGAGEGLFAKRSFQQGEKICDYRGKVLSLADVLKEPNRDYVMGLGLNCHVDAREAYAVPGRYVNDREDPNARFVKDKKRRKADVVALRRIHPGDEIYASYGQGYWRAR